MRRNKRLQNRFAFIPVLVLAGLCAHRPAAAQWSGDPTVNTPISRSPYQEWDPLVVSDGADGAIIVWKQFVGSGFGFDIMAQRIDALGTIKWSSGVDICSALRNQEDYSIVSDGAGGAIIAWDDERSPTTNDIDIYAQQVDASGNVKWQANGIPICKVSSIQAYPKIVSDGSGGAIITWRDSRNYPTNGVDIYAQRVNASGTALWTGNGVPICTAAGDQLDPEITSDGSGGAIIAWRDERDASGYSHTYVQRVNASGTTLWTNNGVGYQTNSNQMFPQIASDGSGGAFIVWQDDYSGTSDLDIRALRINASGNHTWTPASVWISGSNGNQMRPQIASDGSGNAIIAWRDYRNGAVNPDIYAQRLTASGAATWTGWGTPICNASGRQEGLQLVADTFGGAIMTWHDYRSGTTDIYAQRIEASGAVKWKSNGVEISTAPKPQNSPAIVRAGTCGAIITWSDQRWVGDPFNDTDWDIYAQRVFCDGSLAQNTITLDVPNGGESWQAGTPHIIVWHNKNFSDPVKIEYSTDGGITYSTIVASTANTGSYTWTVPNTPSTQCRVRISDAADGNPSDASDANFTITSSESITLDVPNGAENWVVGTPHFIIWHNHLFNGPVKIEYSTDSGTTYNTIIASTSNTGSYQWTIPNTPSTNCLVKVADAMDGNPWDVSDATFTISATGGNNTQPGNNVEVDLGSGVKVTFDNVTGAGNTTLNVKTSGAAPPGGFAIVPLGSPLYYSITTTASFSGNIKVCVQYNDAGMTPAQEAVLKLQVYESPPGSWNDITTSLDVNTNIICGTVSHLSDFAVMMPTGGQSITVIQPNGGENLQAGSEYWIEWSSVNFADPVHIEYSTDGGASYSTVIASTENDGAYLWTIPNTASTNCRVKISDAADGDPFDVSDADFTITSGVSGGVILVTNTSDSEPGSLRDAILQANAHVGMDTIFFAIPKGVPGYDADVGIWTIEPASELPDITDPGLLIDGNSQAEFIGEDVNPNGPEIQLDGSNAGVSGVGGLNIYTAVIEIYGLTINRFSSAGIYMHGAEDVRISGCYIGTDFAGIDSAGNETGLWLRKGTKGVHIGPTESLKAGNVISGNKVSGVLIADSSSHNIVVGNFIGLNRMGAGVVGNQYGIAIWSQSDSNQVFDNRIGGNSIGVGIWEANDNVIANNLIGTDEAWQLEFGNLSDGVNITGSIKSQGNIIEENLIGYSGQSGVEVSGAQAIHNPIRRNILSRNGGLGIDNIDGGNTELTPPVIVTATSAQVTGTAGAGQIVEVFADENDEGLIYLGSTTADASGNFILTLSNPLPPLPYVTATATDAAGNTSEFSSAFVTAVEDALQTQVPEEFSLSQNYPNPFNPQTVIRYELPKKAHVILRIVNLLGEEVVTLVDEEKSAGSYSVHWDGTDYNGRRAASGIYLYRLEAGDFVAVKKMLFLK